MRLPSLEAGGPPLESLVLDWLAAEAQYKVLGPSRPTPALAVPARDV